MLAELCFFYSIANSIINEANCAAEQSLLCQVAADHFRRGSWQTRRPGLARHRSSWTQPKVNLNGHYDVKPTKTAAPVSRAIACSHRYVWYMKMTCVCTGCGRPEGVSKMVQTLNESD